MGGAERSFWFLSAQLKTDPGFEVFGAFPPGTLYGKFKKNFLKVQPLLMVEFIPKAVNLLWPLRLFIYALTLAVNFLLSVKEILLHKIDLVYVNSSIQLSTLLAAKMLGRRAIVFVREDYFYDRPGLKRWLFGLLAGSARLLFCQSIKLAAQFKRVKVSFLYDSAYELKDEPQSRMETPSPDFKIGLIGKIYPLKGQETLIRALGIVDGEHLPIKAYLYGSCRRFSSNQRYLRKLQALIRDLKLEEKVVLAGEPLSLKIIYSGLDAVVIASENEGFSLIFPEALKFGKPVISTRTGIMAEVGREGENLLFFDYNDHQALANKLISLYRDAGLRKRLVGNGKELFQRMFDERLTAETFKRGIKETVLEDRT
jgi:glycosyltransferase involved in cell wall biosynthesis